MAVSPGQGATLKMTISSTLTALAQVVEIDGPGMEVGTKEITNLGDTVKKYRAQLPDGGEINATIEYDYADATHAFLATTVGTWPQAAVACEVNFTASHKAAFSAVLTKFAPKGMNTEDNLEADITLKVTGAVVWT